MLLHFFKTTFRNFWRTRTLTLINMIGLAVGLASFMLILRYVVGEWQYDRFHTQAERIFRVVEVQNQAGTLYDVARTPAPLAAELSAAFPEIETSARLGNAANLWLHYADDPFDDIQGIYADPSLFELFDFKMTQGSIEALAEPNTICLSQGLALRIFGEKNPIGERLVLRGREPFVVAGIFAEVPQASHLQFDCILPFAALTARGMDLTRWNPNAFYTYFLLGENQDPDQLASKLTPWFTELTGWEEVSLGLQPLTDIYLYSNFDFNTDFGPRGDFRYVLLFVGIAVVLLLMACINFINLSTASALGRSKELGLRKVIGARKEQLVLQFLGETALLIIMAALLSITLLQVIEPLLYPLAGKEIKLELAWGIQAAGAAVLLLLTTLMAGAYPAFFLSGLNPVAALKGRLQQIDLGITLRKVLVITQFGVSLLLISASLGVFLQLDFLQNKKLGLDKAQILYVPLKGNLQAQYEPIKEKLGQYPAISHCSGTNRYSMPFEWVGSSTLKEWPDQQVEKEILVSQFRADHGFIETLGLEIVEGRSFNADLPGDRNHYLLNERAVAEMGFEDPVGKRFQYFDEPEGQIIGVVKDFHFNSLESNIEPAMFQYKPQEVDYLLVRTQAGEMQAGIAALRETLDQFEPNYPYTYHFLDQQYDALYKSEQISGDLIRYFTALAILVAALGLFGLAIFASSQRKKEVGIRKVLGASASQIVLLFYQDYLRLILWAFGLSLPIVIWGMQYWLNAFAYRVELPFWFWGVPSFAMVLLTFVVVCMQTYRTANANPALALNEEMS